MYSTISQQLTHAKGLFLSRVSTPYLKQFGNVAGGFYLARGAVAAALAVNEGGDTGYFETRISIAKFFADNYLTEAVGLTDAVTAGAEVIKSIDPKLLSA